jgi:hypothetical protein
VRDNYVSPPSYSHDVVIFILKEHSYFDTSVLRYFSSEIISLHYDSGLRQDVYFKRLKYAMCIILSNCQFANLRGKGVIVPLAPSPHATDSPLPHIVNIYFSKIKLAGS